VGGVLGRGCGAVGGGVFVGVCGVCVGVFCLWGVVEGAGGWGVVGVGLVLCGGGGGGKQNLMAERFARFSHLTHHTLNNT